MLKELNMQAVYKILVAMFLFYIGYCCLLFLLQRQIIFPRYLISIPSDGPRNMAGVEKIWLEFDSAKVEAWFLPAVMPNPQSPAPLWLSG